MNALETDKLGGTSVDDLQQSGRVIAGNRESGKALLVFTSARSKVTTKLQDTIRVAIKRGVTKESPPRTGKDDESEIPDYWVVLKENAEASHQHIDENVDEPREADPLHKMVDGRTNEAMSDFATMARTKTLFPAVRDRHCALLGEGVTAPTFAAHLRCSGVDAVDYEAEQIMITDSNFGNANPIIAGIRDRSKESGLISDLMGGKVVVIGGYYGADKDGRITTFSRGGSDRSATAVSQAFTVWFNPVSVSLYKADKKIAGIMSADPKVVEGAHSVGHMHYLETSTLATIGGNVIHAKAVDHAIRSGGAKRPPFPIYVKSTVKPELPGTLIDNQIRPDDPPIKVVSVVTKAVGIVIRGMGMDKPGIMGKVTGAFAGAGIDIAYINQPSQLELALAYHYTGREEGDKLEKKLQEESETIQQILRNVLKDDMKTYDVDSVSAKPASLLGVIGIGAAGVFNPGKVFNGRPDTYRMATGTYGISLLIDSRDEEFVKKLAQSIHDSVFERAEVKA